MTPKAEAKGKKNQKVKQQIIRSTSLKITNKANKPMGKIQESQDIKRKLMKELQLSTQTSSDYGQP